MSAALRIGLDLSCAAETPLTGIGYATLHQVTALAKLNRDLSIFAAGGAGARKLIETQFPQVQRKRVYSRTRLIKYYAWTRLQWPPMEWFCGSIDIAHNLCHALPATKRARRVVTIHDLSVFRHPETHTPRTVHVQSALLRQAIAHADHLIAVSAFTKQELIDVLGADPGSVTVVPNGVEMEEFDQKRDDDEFNDLRSKLGLRDRYFMYLGSIEPRKNVVRLVEAFAQLRETTPHCPQLILAGNPAWGAAPTLETIARHGKNNDIVQTGYLDRANVVTLLQNAAACVYPSVYEGFGLPVLESMAAGTPVIASDIPAIREVSDGAALLVPPNDADALADAMHCTLENASETSTRVQHGLGIARQLTWSDSAQALCRCYEDVAQGSRVRRDKQPT